MRRTLRTREGSETGYSCAGEEQAGTAPMMSVLSLSSWWEVSIEGIVPDMERGRVWAITAVDEGEGDGGLGGWWWL